MKKKIEYNSKEFAFTIGNEIFYSTENRILLRIKYNAWFIYEVFQASDIMVVLALSTSDDWGLIHHMSFNEKTEKGITIKHINDTVIECLLHLNRIKTIGRIFLHFQECEENIQSFLSEEVISKCLLQDANLISFVNNLTSFMQICAITKNPNLVQYLEDVSNEVQDYAEKISKNVCVYRKPEAHISCYNRCINRQDEIIVNENYIEIFEKREQETHVIFLQNPPDYVKTMFKLSFSD